MQQALKRPNLILTQRMLLLFRISQSVMLDFRKLFKDSRKSGSLRILRVLEVRSTGILQLTKRTLKITKF